VPEVLDTARGPRALPRLDHLRALLSPAGVVQFGRGDVPDPASGTCLDDNARALLVAVMALGADPDYDHAVGIGDVALAFIERARRPDDLYHNFADIRGRFLDSVGSEDSVARMVWACGVTARCAVAPEWRRSALAALEAALPAVLGLRSIHARAYALLGVAAAIAPNSATNLSASTPPPPRPLSDALVSILRALADGLERDFRSEASVEWSWWKPTLTWGNGRLPEAMLVAASVTGEPRYASVGLRALEFLAGVTQDGDAFIPIGNAGWFAQGGHRARYDQQPIEACGMVDAWLAAHRLTGDSDFLGRASTAFEWFLGRNTENLSVADLQTGGCCDGLQRGRLNQNQGAESTLSYVHASLSIRSR
jgi:hypothetical protein